MNDKIIINAISKLHFIIVSVIFFIFLTLSSVFIILQNGVYVKNISLPNVKVKKLYIKWDEKLSVKAQEINIIANSKKKKSNISLFEIDNFFKIVLLFDEWFEEIDLPKITFNDINTSFKYQYAKDGFLNLSSKDFSIKSSLYFEDELFVLKIDSFNDFKRKIDANGYLILDLNSKINLTSSLYINMNDDIKVQIYADSTKDKLRYKVKPIGKIKSIDHIMQIIKMPKEVKYWAYEAIKTSDIDLKYAFGWLEYKKQKDFIKNIRILAIANNLKYTYNPKLKPVVTKDTELEFKNGVLFIRPHDAYQYGFYLNKSWLKIDFTKKEELLTLFLLFKGKVTKDLLYLLNTYKIKLPFLQNTGSVDTNLKIEVNLRTIAVKAKGDFFTKKANFNYLGLDIDIFNAKIFLDNYDVKIKNMLSKYKNIATAKVNVDFNAKKQEGLIDFNFKDISFKDIDLKLNNSKLLNVKYTISNVQDYIQVKQSKWKCKNIDFYIPKIKLPFNLKTLSTVIPNTYIKSKNIDANIYGVLTLAPMNLNANLKLTKFNLNDIKLKQKNILFKIKYDGKLLINSNKKIDLKIKKLTSKIDKINLKLSNNILEISDTNFKIKDILNVDFNAKYNLKSNTATANIKKINLKDSDFGGIFYSQKNIHLKVKSNKKRTLIEAEKLGIYYILKEKNWELKANFLDKIYHNSKLLRDHNITNGQLSISQNNNQNINFSLKTNYPYRFLVLDNKPIENYILKGKFNTKNKKSSLKINDVINIEISKDITIDANKIGININEILRYFNTKDFTSNTNTKDTKKIFFNTKNSFLYISKNRHVISQNINLTYINNVAEATLKYKKGIANFKLSDDKVYLNGTLFNDEFMDNLFALSKFEGGYMSFSVAGTTKEYNTIIYIKNTIVHDYKILNNILAFVNTVPSLVTFSVPGYSKYGLEIKDAYANIYTKNDTFYINNLSLNSKELDIVGSGIANLKTNHIDLNLDLKTDIGSSVSKIPLVGYILLGNDTVSTSMQIKGKLDDPEVKSLIAKDIVTAPLNILKRAITSPFELFKKKKEK